jgi:hypothetical protein
MSETLSSNGSGRPHFRAGWALPLIPVAISGFLLSAMTWLRIQGPAPDDLRSGIPGLIVGLYRAFGFEPLFMVCVLALTWSSIWFLTGQADRPLARLARIAALGLCLAILINLRVDGTLPAGGGEVGALLATRLSAVFSPSLSILLVASAAVAALLLATDFFFYGYFERIGKRAADRSGATAVLRAEVETLEELRLEVPPPPTAAGAPDASLAEEDVAEEDVAEGDVAGAEESEPEVLADEGSGRELAPVGSEEPSGFEEASRAAEDDDLAAGPLAPPADPGQTESQESDPSVGLDVAEPDGELGDEPLPPVDGAEAVDSAREPSRRAARLLWDEIADEAEGAGTVRIPAADRGDAGDGERESKDPPVDELPDGDLPIDASWPDDAMIVEARPASDEAPSDEVPSEEDSDEQLGEEPGEDHLVDGISAEAEPGDRFADDAASDQAELEAEFAAEELVDGGVDELDVERTPAAVGPTEPIVEIVPAPPPLASKFDPELVAEAEQLVVEFRRASANFLRRRLRISLDESLDLLQELARRGVIDCEVGSAQGRLVARD